MDLEKTPPNVPGVVPVRLSAWLGKAGPLIHMALPADYTYNTDSSMKPRRAILARRTNELCSGCPTCANATRGVVFVAYGVPLEDFYRFGCSHTKI